MGKKHAEEMDFWTRDEFNTFIKYFEDKPKYYAMFMTLYYTGIREGEMLALTPRTLILRKQLSVSTRPTRMWVARN